MTVKCANDRCTGNGIYEFSRAADGTIDMGSRMWVSPQPCPTPVPGRGKATLSADANTMRFVDVHERCALDHQFQLVWTMVLTRVA